MGARAPKKPQEAPKTASETDFGAILVDFLVDFLVVFWLVWGFISALLACCGVGLLPCSFVGLLISWSVSPAPNASTKQQMVLVCLYYPSTKRKCQTTNGV